MPNYDFQCRTCGAVTEIYLKLDQFADSMFMDCSGCHAYKQHDLVLSAPAVENWGQGRYFDELAPRGKTFYDKASYKRYLKEHGLIEWAPKTGMPGSGI